MASAEQMIERARADRARKEAANGQASSRRPSEKFADVWAEIQRLELESHVAELDAVGYFHPAEKKPLTWIPSSK